MGSGNTIIMSCVKVANDNDGYGSGNMCQLPSIEGNEFESIKVVTHTSKQQTTKVVTRVKVAKQQKQ